MSSLGILVLCGLLQIPWSLSKQNSLQDVKFPPGFKFGAATSAYQVEGGWNADGKTETQWDRFVHTHPHFIPNNVTGDIAVDSYHQWQEDVRIAAEMGLDFYRFSINWPRILPTGFVNEFNEVGAKYYSDLIDALLAKGIEPVITMYHYELPISIYELGGWANPLIVEWFGDFARVLFKLYANRVKTWITFNEPVLFCDFNYNAGPFYIESQFGPFLCNKHVLLAHATAYRIFEKEFKHKYEGKFSMANSIVWIDPHSPNDKELAKLGRENLIGRYAHPIYSKQGGWPPAIEQFMLEYSLKQGYKKSRLPAFTKEEIDFIKGTGDYFGLNYYGTLQIRPAKPGESGVWFMSGSPELNAMLESPPGAPFSANPYLATYPKGLRRHLAWLKKQYGDINILISENGYSTSGYNLDDFDRIKNMKEHLEQVLLAMTVDKVNVTGFTVWSLMDAFEWIIGTKYGLYEVDFEDPKRTRTPRASAFYYSCLIEYRTLRGAESCLREYE